LVTRYGMSWTAPKATMNAIAAYSTALRMDRTVEDRCARPVVMELAFASMATEASRQGHRFPMPALYLRFMVTPTARDSRLALQPWLPASTAGRLPGRLDGPSPDRGDDARQVAGPLP
jgi:hypothetical protein